MEVNGVGEWHEWGQPPFKDLETKRPSRPSDK